MNTFDPDDLLAKVEDQVCDRICIGLIGLRVPDPEEAIKILHKIQKQCDVNFLTPNAEFLSGHAKLDKLVKSISEIAQGVTEEKMDSSSLEFYNFITSTWKALCNAWIVFGAVPFGDLSLLASVYARAELAIDPAERLQVFFVGTKGKEVCELMASQVQGHVPVRFQAIFSLDTFISGLDCTK